MAEDDIKAMMAQIWRYNAYERADIRAFAERLDSGDTLGPFDLEEVRELMERIT